MRKKCDLGKPHHGLTRELKSKFQFFIMEPNLRKNINFSINAHIISWYYFSIFSRLCINSVGFATRSAGMAMINLTLISSSFGKSQVIFIQNWFGMRHLKLLWLFRH